MSAALLNSLRKAAIALLAALLAPAAVAQAPAPTFERQDAAVITRAVEQFLKRETAGLPGQVGYTVGTLDARTVLPACPAMEAFVPAGSRLWGNATVGVRCVAGATWAVQVPVNVRVTGQYWITARPLGQGQTVVQEDLVSRSGDLTQLPGGAVTELKQALGKTVTVSIAAGHPLRQDMLRAPVVVTQGQTVRLVGIGRGFQVTSEGRAVTNASEGQPARIQTAAGQIVTGVARANGVVEVAF